MAKILIVEDDTFLQGLEVSTFKKAGFDVEISSDGKGAVGKVDGTKFDCILLDLMLPGEIDGFGVLEKVRAGATNKETPVLVFSNMADTDSFKKATGLGATEFIIKSSVVLEELVDKVKGFAK